MPLSVVRQQSSLVPCAPVHISYYACWPVFFLSSCVYVCVCLCVCFVVDVPQSTGGRVGVVLQIILWHLVLCFIFDQQFLYRGCVACASFVYYCCVVVFELYYVVLSCRIRTTCSRASSSSRSSSYSSSTAQTRIGRKRGAIFRCTSCDCALFVSFQE